jgi:Ni/Co efflux regulator RcnB
MKHLWTPLATIMLVGLVATSMTGCASDSRHDSSRSTSEVRRDSDRFFDKMKEDKRSRGESSERKP